MWGPRCKKQPVSDGAVGVDTRECRDDFLEESRAEPRAGGGTRRGHTAGLGVPPDASALHAGEEGSESAACGTAQQQPVPPGSQTRGARGAGLREGLSRAPTDAPPA